MEKKHLRYLILLTSKLKHFHQLNMFEWWIHFWHLQSIDIFSLLEMHCYLLNTAWVIKIQRHKGGWTESLNRSMFLILSFDKGPENIIHIIPAKKVCTLLPLMYLPSWFGTWWIFTPKAQCEWVGGYLYRAPVKISTGYFPSISQNYLLLWNVLLKNKWRSNGQANFSKYNSEVIKWIFSDIVAWMWNSLLDQCLTEGEEYV